MNHLRGHGVSRVHVLLFGQDKWEYHFSDMNALTLLVVKAELLYLAWEIVSRLDVCHLGGYSYW